MTENRKKLSRILGYEFSDSELLEHALTHRSAGRSNNERMEFLGDAVLGFIVAGLLYKKFPEATEGELSRLRSNLVRKETLAAIARGLELGSFILLGPGEMKSGGARRDSILADSLESLLAAIYLDSGVEACQEFVARIFAEKLENLPGGALQKDPKTRLQEYMQAHQMELPVYKIISAKGKAHAQTFSVECAVLSPDKQTCGKGSSRQRAEQAAAQLMLVELGL